MKRTVNMKVYYEDRLVKRWQDPETRRTYSQGKRVKNGCPLTPEERALYVSKGAVSCIKAIMDRLGYRLSQAKELFDKARRY